MDASTKNIDILENTLLRAGNLLDILLLDRTTTKNIIWATDSYEKYGTEISYKLHISSELVTGDYGKLIQPRSSKSLEEQKKRTKDKAEVFTPLQIVKQINKAVENRSINKNNWQEYIQELKLEISCGEAPFIVTRYNPISHTRKLITLNKRVGFLDKKLKVVSKYSQNKNEWILWAKEAFKASYGYEWQGDNVLLARENLLYTLIDYYETKFQQNPSLKVQEEFAEIISWNIFQMDGLKYVVPLSCHSERKVIPGMQSFFEEVPEKIINTECEGCKNNDNCKHNGKYVRIKDWSKNKTIKFIDLL